MPKYGFLVVEGPHDVEFAYRLLSPFGLQRVRTVSDLDPLFRQLIPREYPPGGDLQIRMSTPLFLRSVTHVLALHSARGDSRLVETLQENLSILDPAPLTGVGILLDADLDKTTSAAARYSAIRAKMLAIGMPLPAAAGAVSGANPKRGCFVLPDNVAQGTLEDILLECAQLVYPILLGSATAHLAAAMKDATLTKDDLDQVLNKPSGKNKAIAASISSILRPGKAIQASVQDNRWLRGPTLALPRVKAVQTFLTDLFELP